MDLIILRCVFLLCAGGVSAIINASLNAANSNEVMPWLVFIGVMALAVVVVIGDIYAPRKRIDTITSVYFGVLVGDQPFDLFLLKSNFMQQCMCLTF